MNKQGKFSFYRNFGSLSNDSVVTDFYKKRISAKRKKKMSMAKGGKCIIRKATEEEINKYRIGGDQIWT